MWRHPRNHRARGQRLAGRSAVLARCRRLGSWTALTVHAALPADRAPAPARRSWRGRGALTPAVSVFCEFPAVDGTPFRRLVRTVVPLPRSFAWADTRLPSPPVLQAARPVNWLIAVTSGSLAPAGLALSPRASLSQPCFCQSCAEGVCCPLLSFDIVSFVR